MTEETVTTTEAAVLLGVKPPTIAYLVHEKFFKPVGKKLTGKRGLPQHVFLLSDILAYETQRQAKKDGRKATPCVVCCKNIARQDRYCKHCGKIQP